MSSPSITLSSAIRIVRRYSRRCTGLGRLAGSRGTSRTGQPPLPGPSHARRLPRERRRRRPSEREHMVNDSSCEIGRLSHLHRLAEWRALPLPPWP